MRAKLLQKRYRLLLAGVLAGLGLMVWAWRVGATRPAPDTALRTELVLREGVLYRPSVTLPFQGLLVENWRPAQRRVEGTIVEGRAHGRSRGWYENGQIEVEEHFVHGISHGTRTRWFAAGGRKSQVEIRQGQLTGTFWEWHPNGQRARETPLRDGVPHGEARSWDAQGKLAGTAQVEHGQRVARD